MSLSQHEPEPESYHGIPVLELHVGDAVPTPRAPSRYAVRVHPDLARYLLGFNNEHNRGLSRRRIQRYAEDMAGGRWRFTPASLVFSTTGVLQDGQHRLVAITEAGATTWLMMDVGWPDDIITALDQGAARSNADAFALGSIPYSARITSIIAYVHRYDLVRDGNRTRSFSGLPTPSAETSLAVYQQDPEGWQAAAVAGDRVYRMLDKSLSCSTWGAAHRLIARTRGALADEFLTELVEGTGAPRSATRTLADFYRRRPVSETKSTDTREPIENIIRGFNAWRAGKTVSLVTRPGFELSPVR